MLKTIEALSLPILLLSLVATPCLAGYVCMIEDRCSTEIKEATNDKE